MLNLALPAPERIAVIVVLSPLLEESVFRAGLQEWLLRRGMGSRPANVFTALAFGALHALMRPQWLSLAVAVPALLIGGLYDRWRLVRWCVVCHATMNIAWLYWRSVSGAGA